MSNDQTPALPYSVFCTLCKLLQIADDVSLGICAVRVLVHIVHNVLLPTPGRGKRAPERAPERAKVQREIPIIEESFEDDNI